MANSKLAGLLFEAWNDLDRALAGLDAEQAVHAGDGSSFAWTAAHVANQVDAWINVRFAGRAPHALIGETRFRVGGTGAAENWRGIREAVAEVRRAARAYLEPLRDADLDLVVPYDGSFVNLRESGLPLRFAVMRAAVHHYFHTGEIASKRAALGHDVGDYPGALTEAL